MKLIVPSQKGFNQISKKESSDKFIPIYMKIKLNKQDNLTPISVYDHFKDKKDSVILESVKNGRFSYVCLNPILTVKGKNNNIELINDDKSKTLKGDPFNSLKKIVKDNETIKPKELPMFFGGLIGYMGYDLVHFIEDLPQSTIDDQNLPDCYLISPGLIFAFDHRKEMLYVIIQIKNKSENYEKACIQLKSIYSKLVKTKESKNKDQLSYYKDLINNKDKKNIDASKIKSNFTFKEYEKAIKKAKDYVLAGDSFQIKISQRFEVKITSQPYAIYNVLRLINPSPYAAFINFKDVKLISCSPEHLLKVEDEIVTTRPIGGTYPRGKDSKEDKKLAAKFFDDKKELAEHTMLIDLERNDLGKVCQYGTVKVNELMSLEKYSHLMHIVTNITGKLKKDKDCFDALKAMFPGGTITGCPKVRTMEIIDELEPTARGPYTGSIGFISFANDLDINIAIRTLIVKGDKGYIQVGGGIVVDSDPKTEYDETVNKGLALIEAVKLVEDKKK